MNKEKIQLKIYDIVWLLFYIALYTFNGLFDNSQIIYTAMLLLTSILHLLSRGNYVRIKLINRTDCVFWYGIFYLYIVISYFWSSTGGRASQNTAFALVQSVIFLLCIDWYVRTERELEILMRWYCLASLFFAVVVLVTSPPSSYGQLAFGSFTGMQRNSTGYILMFAAILDVYRAITKKKKYYYFMAAICCVVSLLTGSRKVIIGYAIAVVSAIYLQKSIAKVIKSFLGIILLLIIAIPLIYQIPFMQEVFGLRLLAIFDDTIVDGSVLARENAKELAIALTIKSPIIGNGWNSVVSSYIEYWGGTESIYAHNNYLEVAANFGLIGIVLFYWRFATVLFKSWKCARVNIKYKLLTIVFLIVIILDYGQVTYCYLFMMTIFSIFLKMFVIENAKENKKRELEISDENKNCYSIQ